jgi:hypothetical protein
MVKAMKGRGILHKLAVGTETRMTVSCRSCVSDKHLILGHFAARRSLANIDVGVGGGTGAGSNSLGARLRSNDFHRRAIVSGSDGTNLHRPCSVYPFRYAGDADIRIGHDFGDRAKAFRRSNHLNIDFLRRLLTLACSDQSQERSDTRETSFHITMIAAKRKDRQRPMPPILSGTT